jgi:small neutral amino acid transporter SnatA (MarC family)
MTAVLVLNASYGLWVTLSALVLTFLVTWGILMAGGGIFLRLGKTGSGIIAQVMALLLATIAVQFIRTGLATLWTMVQKQL